MLIDATPRWAYFDILLGIGRGPGHDYIHFPSGHDATGSSPEQPLLLASGIDGILAHQQQEPV